MSQNMTLVTTVFPWLLYCWLHKLQQHILLLHTNVQQRSQWCLWPSKSPGGLGFSYCLFKCLKERLTNNSNYTAKPIPIHYLSGILLFDHNYCWCISIMQICNVILKRFGGSSMAMKKNPGERRRNRTLIFSGRWSDRRRLGHG